MTEQDANKQAVTELIEAIKTLGANRLRWRICYAMW